MRRLLIWCRVFNSRVVTATLEVDGKYGSTKTHRFDLCCAVDGDPPGSSAGPGSLPLVFETMLRKESGRDGDDDI